MARYGLLSVCSQSVGLVVADVEVELGIGVVLIARHGGS